MKYKCLVFDHDDTVVNSTATIHYPSFIEYLKIYDPDRVEECTLDEYFRWNFDPGFIEACRTIYRMDDAQLEREVEFWRDYVSTRIPSVYPGMKEIMERQKAEGGRIAVISHSMKENILRDYAANSLPEPDLVYGWEEPEEHRKPEAWPMEQVMCRFGLQPEEILMVDDLKPGYDMAVKCGTAFAAAGWANDVVEIEDFMRKSCSNYFKTVKEFAAFLQ